MNDILSSKQLNDEEKAKLYNQVLQRYLTYYDQRKGQPLQVKLATSKSLETPKPEEIKESSKESTDWLFRLQWKKRWWKVYPSSTKLG